MAILISRLHEEPVSQCVTMELCTGAAPGRLQVSTERSGRYYLLPSLPQPWRTGGPSECPVLNARVGVSKRRKESVRGEKGEEGDGREKGGVGEKGKGEVLRFYSVAEINTIKKKNNLGRKVTSHH